MATIHFVRPSDGAYRRVASLWRVWGVLFGVLAMLRAGLWLHSLIAIMGSVVFGVVMEIATGYGPGHPNYLITYVPGWLMMAIYGGFIPRLRARKYDRLGWKRVEATDDVRRRAR